ncbi:MAG: adenosylmethionine decarboxylase [archaeon]|nr:adenosylmethionine decarboxylase [archaeon]
MNQYFFLKQYIGDYWDCDLSNEQINSSEFLSKSAEKAVEYSNTQVIKQLEHKFNPQGYTLLMVLADSSLTLHSWPEEKFISVEIFTCSERSQPLKGLKYLENVFKPNSFEIKEVNHEKKK